MINRILWHAACATALMLFPACGHRQPYPRTWPTLVDDRQGCEQLAGDYRDQEDTTQSLPTSLTQLLVGDPPDVRNRPDSVRFSFSPDNQLQVDVAAIDGELFSLVLTGEQFACQSGTLIIRTGAHWVGAGPVYGFFSVGRQSTSLELRSAAGYLIMKNRTNVFAVVTMIPWRYTEHSWHRFERLPAS